MAIYHLHPKVMIRSNGDSAVAAAAYRSGEKLIDERTGETFDYTRKQSVLHSEIMTPDNVPDWAAGREKLWNEVEKKERRKDSQVAREVEVALPRELSLEENVELVKEFVQENFVDKGMIADFSIHESEAADGEKNPHAHILLTKRGVTEEGFGLKNIAWDKKEMLAEWRENWANIANSHLENHTDSGEKIDHRTLEAQGIDREPTVHMGKDATALERQGVTTDRAEENVEIGHFNRMREYAAAAADWMKESTLDIYNRISQVLQPERENTPAPAAEMAIQRERERERDE